MVLILNLPTLCGLVVADGGLQRSLWSGQRHRSWSIPTRFSLLHGQTQEMGCSLLAPISQCGTWMEKAS